MHKAINLLSDVERYAATHTGRRFKYLEICIAAEKDPVTKKIKRASLAHKIYCAARGDVSVEYAVRKFNEWVQAEWHEYELVRGDLGLKKRSFEEFKAIHGSRDKEKLIADYETALSITEAFFNWLEYSKNRDNAKPLQSSGGDNKGKFVSLEARGSERNQQGKFSPKK